MLLTVVGESGSDCAPRAARARSAPGTRASGSAAQHGADQEDRHHPPGTPSSRAISVPVREKMVHGPCEEHQASPCDSYQVSNIDFALITNCSVIVLFCCYFHLRSYQGG